MISSGVSDCCRRYYGYWLPQDWSISITRQCYSVAESGHPPEEVREDGDSEERERRPLHREL